MMKFPSLSSLKLVRTSSAMREVIADHRRNFFTSGNLKTLTEFGSKYFEEHRTRHTYYQQTISTEKFDSSRAKRLPVQKF